MERNRSQLQPSEHAELRKQEIAGGLLDLMMQMPYEKIAVRDLCEYLKISRKTFYRYFSNKEDALRELMDQTILNVGTYRLPGDPSEEHGYLNEMMRFFCYWSENRRILQLLLDNSLIEILLFRMLSVTLSEMELFQKDRNQFRNEKQESRCAYYVGGLLSMLLCWLRNGSSAPPEEMARRAVYLIGDSLKREDM